MYRQITNGKIPGVLEYRSMWVLMVRVGRVQKGKFLLHYSKLRYFSTPSWLSSCQ